MKVVVLLLAGSVVLFSRKKGSIVGCSRCMIDVITLVGLSSSGSSRLSGIASVALGCEVLLVESPSGVLLLPECWSGSA